MGASWGKWCVQRPIDNCCGFYSSVTVDLRAFVEKRATDSWLLLSGLGPHRGAQDVRRLLGRLRVRDPRPSARPMHPHYAPSVLLGNAKDVLMGCIPLPRLRHARNAPHSLFDGTWAVHCALRQPSMHEASEKSDLSLSLEGIPDLLDGAVASELGQRSVSCHTVNANVVLNKIDDIIAHLDEHAPDDKGTVTRYEPGCCITLTNLHRKSSLKEAVAALRDSVPTGMEQPKVYGILECHASHDDGTEAVHDAGGDNAKVNGPACRHTWRPVPVSTLSNASEIKTATLLMVFDSKNAAAVWAQTVPTRLLHALCGARYVHAMTMWPSSLVHPDPDPPPKTQW